MNYQWILFDADNTLLDFTRSERDALRLALAQVGIVLEETHHQLYHRINKACWESFEHGQLSKEDLRTRRFQLFFKEIGLEADENHFSESYLGYLGQTEHLIEGAMHTLEVLKENYGLGLVTNGLKEVQRPRLARARIDGFFQAVVVSDEIGYAKPDSAFFEFTFGQIGHPPKEAVLMVGDNLNADIRGGAEFGIHTCWYNPRQEENKLGVSPTYEVAELQKLDTFL